MRVDPSGGSRVVVELPIIGVLMPDNRQVFLEFPTAREGSGFQTVIEG
ncbi:hypothetical protein [Enteroscipio rubneri]